MSNGNKKKAGSPPLLNYLYMTLKYSVGIDLSKATFHVCISTIDALQQVTAKRSGTFANTPAGFGLLHQWLQQEHKDPAVPLSILMEATGVYYEQCALYLYQQGYRLSVVLPNKANKYVAALGGKSKNDKADAKALSRMGAEQALDRWEPMNGLFYELRELTRHNESLKVLHTSLHNQLEAASSGMYASQLVVQGLQALLETVEQQIADNTKAISAQLRKDAAVWQRVGHLVSIPGVGELTAAVVLAETNGFTLFNSLRQLVSYAGYDVVENQSGSHVGRTKISKKGNGHLRRILHMPALSVVSHGVKVFSDLFERTLSRHGIKMKSYVAVQKKLLEMCYTMWKRQEDFDRAYGQQQPVIATTKEEKEAHCCRPSLAA